MNESLKIQFDNGDKSKPVNLKEAVKSMLDNFDDHAEFYRMVAKLKRVQYKALINEGFTKPETMMLIKDGFKI